MGIRREVVALALAGLTLAAPALAQDEEEGGDAPAEPSGPPTVTGRSEAVGFVTRQGMTFELAGARAWWCPRISRSAPRAARSSP
ncbi:MAG: hypothetical protein M5U28_21500 [Sandaracinaceae bacterium]|nr:hypothetical protein [Sandaracinaceae bacterium]